jgi:hypothetical protein
LRPESVSTIHTFGGTILGSSRGAQDAGPTKLARDPGIGRYEGVPVAGIDGSLADRFPNLDPQTHVYAKTGSLGGVKALSGYAITARGQRVEFSILSNNLNLPNKRMLDAIDNVVEVIVSEK